MVDNYSEAKKFTDANGRILHDNEHSLTYGENGPMLMQDIAYLNKMAHFDRERIPERVVHAKGSGAFGYFEVTNDITKYSKACVFSEVGKKTPILARFSTVGGEKGSADTARDPRGFSLKFYTEEGNWDMVGNNTPIFFVRDPIKFIDFIRTQKRDPVTNLKDDNMRWDFWSHSPEALHQVTILYSDRGTPDGYRHMNGYSSHTFKFVNKDNEVFFVKMHFKTDQGIKNLSADKAKQLMSENPDYSTEDLFKAIENKNYPSWTFKIQVMPEKDAEKYEWNILDITKVWPHKDYPLIEVGKMVLNRNPINYFNEIEQSAFSPSNLIPGIEVSNDRMLQGRLMSYPDTHRHRLGVNYELIPVNCPYRTRVYNYQRDGFMNVDNKDKNHMNYYPNSYDNVVFSKEPDVTNISHAPNSNPNNFENTCPSKSTNNSDNVSNKKYKECKIGRFPFTHPNSDFVQPGMLYEKALDSQGKTNLINNLLESLKTVKKDLQIKNVKNFYKCHEEYGTRLAEGLGLDKNIFEGTESHYTKYMSNK